MISFIAWIPVTIYFNRYINKLLLPIKLTIPQTCKTLGDMAKYILHHNINYFGAMNKDEIWDKLTFIISEELGIDQKDIKPESHFVVDLNC